MATAKTIAKTKAKNKMENNKQINTPTGVAVFPRLQEPDYKFQSAGEFSVNLRLTEKDARPLITHLEKMLDAWRKPNLKKAPLPIKPSVDEDGNETGDWDFKFKMKHNGTTKTGKSWTQRPKLYDSKLEGYNGGTIGGGSKIAVNFVPAAYYTPALGCGLTFRLNAVQVVELREYIKQDAAALGFTKQEGYKSPEAEEKPKEVSSEQKEVALADVTEEL